MDNVEFQFSLVIGSDIGEELCNFRNNKSCNTRIVEKILHYYKHYPIFTVSELTREYYRDFPTILKSVLSNITTPPIDIDNSSEKDIAKHTIYKVVLCNDENKKDIFPYIYIGGDKVENNFTATFLSGKSRQKAKEHLKALLENAKCIFVYDLYLFNNNVWKSFIDFAQQCFPNKQLNIFYPQSIVAGQNIQSQCSQIVQNNSQWSFSPDRTHQNFTNLHDRYLIIDNKIEIILTSGIDNLIDDSKDFTYIVRRHKQ